MKTHPLLLLTLLLTGCQNSPKAPRHPTEAIDYVNTRIDNEPPLRLPTEETLNPTAEPVAPGEVGALFKNRRALLGRLWQLSPIPVPGPTNLPAISAEAAHERYQTFVTTYAADTILPLFQQRYARILLNEYHWLETGRTDVIAYYIDQLLLANSSDVKTITAGLTGIQGKLPAPQFSSLLARALPKAEAQLMTEAVLLSKLAYSTKKPAANGDRYREQRVAWSEYRLSKQKKTYREDSLSVARLRTMLPKRV